MSYLSHSKIMPRDILQQNLLTLSKVRVRASAIGIRLRKLDRPPPNFRQVDLAIKRCLGLLKLADEELNKGRRITKAKAARASGHTTEVADIGQ
jgi:hypothetical protein